MKKIKRIYLRRANCRSHRFLADDEGNVIVQNLTDNQIEQIKEWLKK